MRLDLAIRLGPLGGFSPAALFSGGVQGAWYDPSDLSSMFQDSAGTVPVTATGQPVGRINDKSGNGNHATQATTAAKPTYTESGGLKYLLFDGVDDFITQTAAFGAALAQPNAVAMGVKIDTLASVRGAHNTFFDTTAAADQRIFQDNLDDGLKLFAGGTVNASGGTLAALSYVINGIFDGVSSRNRVNGVNGATVTVGAGTLAQMRLGANGGGNNPMSGRIYGAIIRDTAFSAGEITQVDTYLASKSGVTL